jgi:hypothetical protein
VLGLIGYLGGIFDLGIVERAFVELDGDAQC